MDDEGIHGYDDGTAEMGFLMKIVLLAMVFREIRIPNQQRFFYANHG